MQERRAVKVSCLLEEREDVRLDVVSFLLESGEVTEDVPDVG
jgi:hypothetical protein